MHRCSMILAKQERAPPEHGIAELIDMTLQLSVPSSRYPLLNCTTVSNVRHRVSRGRPVQLA